MSSPAMMQRSAGWMARRMPPRMAPPMVMLLALVSSSCWLGCVAEERFTQRSDAITAAAPSEREAVVAVGLRRASCSTPLAPVCSGTLVADAVVLTAAHCVDRLGADYEVFVGADTADKGVFYDVVKVTLHPDFDDSDNRHDLALLLLERDTGVTPVALAPSALSGAALGEDVIVVGYGMTAGGAEDQGRRLEGTSRISMLDAAVLTTEPGPSMSCLIDSGGPLLYSEPDVEVLIGVTSEGDVACTQWSRSADVGSYVDAFIAPALAAAVSPQTQRCTGQATTPPEAPGGDAGCSVGQAPVGQSPRGQGLPWWGWLGVVVVGWFVRRRRG